MADAPAKQPDALARLEDWNGGHKARFTRIECDDGYGASCWSVELHHEHGRTVACELAFITNGKGWRSTVDEAKSQGCVFASDNGTDEQDDDWPGLSKTIHAAIDAFEAGVWKKKQ
jgi:hypothetical protein